jgi:hypothetical protein
MNIKTLAEIAGTNLAWLTGHRYPGRGIVMGATTTGELVQVYWITGRSEGSQNRRMVQDGTKVSVKPIDPTKIVQPELTIYTAMREEHEHSGHTFIVSNGKQTDEECIAHQTLNRALDDWGHEPDEPNFTPRITGVIRMMPVRDPVFEFAVLKKAALGNTCDRHHHQFTGTMPGYGYGIMTYMDDGDPLPAWDSVPKIFDLPGDINTIASMFWEAMPNDKRVALVVKTIDPDGLSSVKIINNK